MPNNYFLVSTPPPTRVECYSLKDARARLAAVLQSQRRLSNTAIEGRDHRWSFPDGRGGLVTVWIEGADGMVEQFNPSPLENLVGK